MRQLDEPHHSAASIELQEIDSDSTPSNDDTSSSTGASEAETCHQDQDQQSSEPRGLGTAVPPANGSGRRSSDASSASRKPKSWLVKFWTSNVSCEVDHDACRDHLGGRDWLLGLSSREQQVFAPMEGLRHALFARYVFTAFDIFIKVFSLERTFLGYLRTSMVFSMLGTVLAQLFTISHHDTGFGYTSVGKPLATVCFAYSIVTIILGAIRSWRHQYTMISGKALCGGFEIHLLGMGVALLLIVFFGLLIAIDIVKVDEDDTS